MEVKSSIIAAYQLQISLYCIKHNNFVFNITVRSVGYHSSWCSAGTWFESKSMVSVVFCFLRCYWEGLLCGSSTWSHIFVHSVYFYTVTPKIHLNFPKSHLTSLKATNFRLWSSVTEVWQKLLISNKISLWGERDVRSTVPAIFAKLDVIISKIRRCEDLKEKKPDNLVLRASNFRCSIRPRET